MRMIGSVNFMCDRVFEQKGFQKPIAKVFTFIVDDSLRGAKPIEDVCLDELDNKFMIIGFGSSNLYPLGVIIHYHKNVLIPIGKRERSHEVDAPYIKYFNDQDGVKRHHVPLCHCSKVLAPNTRLTASIGVFEQGWPEETAL